MARVLIVGCGCHGRELGQRLAARDLQVRGTSRDTGRVTEIEAAGLEPAPADPDRPGTILDHCGDVSVVVWILGSAIGESVEAVHGPRLERLLEKLVDSPVRGFVYEASGTVGEERLEAGREIVESAARTWRIPVAMIEGDRSDPGWADRAARTVTGLLAE